MLSSLRAALVATTAFVLSTASFAAGIDGLELQAGMLDNESMQMTITQAMIQSRIDSGDLTLTQNGDQITISGSTIFSMAAWELELNSISFDPDPNISIVGGLTNLTPGAANFFISSSIAIAPPVVPSSLMGGSTTLSYGDANFDGLGGLTNATGPLSGYAGSIDGFEQLLMLNAFSLSPDFAGQTKSVSETQGLPGPTIPGPAANATIGITNRFNLSSGDQATWNSTFIVEAIPEPGTALLVGAGLLVLGASRRRR